MTQGFRSSPRRLLRLLVVVAVLVGLGLALANTVVIGVAAEATTLDPRHATDVSSGHVVTLVYAGLIEWDENLNIVPYVAKSIENPDDRTYIFNLRDDVYFHDGTKLTAADVKYTFDTMRDPDFGARNIGFYRDIESIETPDDYTVVITLEQPNSPFIYYMHVGIVPKHYAEEYGSDHIAQYPIGAGPFVFEEWRAGEYVHLSAFEDYLGGTPSISEVRIRPIPDTITRTVELEVGGVQLVDEIDPLDVERLTMDSAIDVMRSPGSGFDYIFMHTQRAPFDDVRVRQAMAYLVPRQDIVDSLLFGVGLVAYTPIIPQSWAHETDVNRFDHDVERARALLADAGYADGFDMVLELSNDPIRRQIGEVM
ncbi:ABC transporter substrate-binding protein, partial [Natronococcus sp.]|uniref:ABC transporter substrate-binding protein n=1 Tax=Natronococcus sp. TaxID=35747 RepID=UPI003A4DA7DC